MSPGPYGRCILTGIPQHDMDMEAQHGTAYSEADSALTAGMHAALGTAGGCNGLSEGNGLRIAQACLAAADKTQHWHGTAWRDNRTKWEVMERGCADVAFLLACAQCWAW